MKGSVRCLKCRKGLDDCGCIDSARELRVYAGVDPVTKRKRWVSRTVRGSKRATRLALAELVAEVGQGRHHASEGTLAHLLERWLEQSQALGRSPSTLRTYRSYVRTSIVPKLGHLELRRLGSADLDRFYRELLAAGKRPSTIHQQHSIISAALNQARKWRWVTENVAELASPPSVGRNEVKAPTIDEVRQLLDKAQQKEPALAVMLWLAATSGARRGELCGLRWSDLDLVERRMTIARSVVDVPGEVHIKTTKSDNVRQIALDDGTVAMLGAHGQLQAAAAEEANLAVGPDGYVFSQALDGSRPWRPDKVTGFFRRTRAELGLQHVRLHHLRHFMATRSLRAAIDVRTVSGRLGHADAGFTLRVYGHFLPEGDREAADAMGRIMAPAPE